MMQARMFDAMSVNKMVYDAGIYLARPLVTMASPFSAKLRKGVQGRRGAPGRLVEWARSQRRPDQQLVWLHAPSVGESLMAQAIAEELRALLPDVQIAFTYFSPSAERMSQNIGADIADYLPWDTSHQVQRVMSALNPTAIAFVRSEIWPTVVRMAAEREIGLSLVNAVLSVNSSRLNPTSRWLFGF